MNVGDTVTNIYPVRNNPVVNETRGWVPIPKGCTGTVLKVKQTDLNSWFREDGRGDVYVDVLITTPEGDTFRCGNYHSGTFAVASSQEAL